MAVGVCFVRVLMCCSWGSRVAVRSVSVSSNELLLPTAAGDAPP